MQNLLTHILSGYSLSIPTNCTWNHAIYESWGAFHQAFCQCFSLTNLLSANQMQGFIVAYKICQWKTLTKHLIEIPPGARKRVAIFINGPIVLQCKHKTQHTHNEAPCRPTEETCHFFPSTLFNKTDALTIKITLNCKKWLLKLCVIKCCLC